MKVLLLVSLLYWCCPAMAHSLVQCHDCLCDNGRNVYCNMTYKQPSALRFPIVFKDYHFESNKLMSLDSHSFSKLTKMEWVFLNNNSLTSLPGKIFSKNPKLKTVHLSNNNLTSLPSQLFNHNPEIEQFYCDNNKITYIDKSVFANLQNLSQIRLNSNQLTAVHPAAFQSSRKLMHLYLEDNHLETAYWQWIANIVQDKATEIELDSNDWSCDCRMWQFVHNVTKRLWFKTHSSRRNYPQCKGPNNHKTSLLSKSKHDLVCIQCDFDQHLPFNGSVDIDVVVGNASNITCSATGMPVPLLTLRNGMKQVLATKKGNIFYEIKSVNRDDMGRYTCTMEGTDKKGNPRIGHVTFNIVIKSSSVSVGSILAILLAFILVVGMASCFWRKRQKRDGYGSLENASHGGSSAYYEMDDSNTPPSQQQTTLLEEENLFSDEDVYTKGDDKEVLV